MADTAATEKLKRGRIELATSGGFGGEDFYKPVPAYIVGALAIHRTIRMATGWRWTISHVATGLAVPGAYGKSLKQAGRVARAIDGAIDWSTIKRGKSIGRSVGMTPEKGRAVHAVIESFSFLRSTAATEAD